MARVRADLPSGRLAFFFSDVEGSTRLLNDLGDRFATFLEDHHRLIRSSLAKHHGIEVSTEGDSFFAIFPSAPDAVRAAADTQRSLTAHAWPPGHEFRVRIGLHVGQAILAGDNYIGIDVNRAARIANAGNGGQVVLSDQMADAVAGALPDGLGLIDLGRHRLRDIGVVRLWQLEIDGLPTRSAALRTLEAHPSNLPAEMTPLIDREDETSALRRSVADAPLVTVTGTGGVGKSRLAIHVAHTLLADFPDGVFYLDLAPLDRVETVVTELARLLEVPISPNSDPTTSLLEHLRGRRALLLLETAESHPGIGTVIAQIVANCPTIRLLVTGRSPLHVRAERELVVQPLGLPAARATVEDALGSPAIELFVRRASAVNPRFELTSSNLAAVVGIVERLDGLPLAVELAAAAVRLLSPSAVRARLENSLPMPGQAALDAPERQRTLRDTIAWSYRLLDPHEQSTLQRLSVFAGAFDLEAVAALVADVNGTGDGADGVEVLGRLVDRSLVQRVESEDEDRYRLLSVIREFAGAELVGAGDADAVRSRHAHYWLDVAARNGRLLDGPDELQALDSLDRAGDEFRAALTWALGTDQAEHLALRLSSTLGRSWYLHGHVHEGASWLARALEADTGAPAEIRAQALHWLGVMLDERRDVAGAVNRLEEALAIWRDLDDQPLIARELNSLGAVHRNVGDYGRAESLLTESLALRRTMGDVGGVATVLTNLGILAIDREQFQEAIDLLEEAVELDRRSGATGGAAYSSSALGTAYLRSGRRDDGIDLLASALATFDDLHDMDGVAETLERLGEAAVAEEPARAARLLMAARSIREQEQIGLRAIDETRASELFSSVATALTGEELRLAQADADAMDAQDAVAYALASRGR